ncbi:MAG TPA: tRNA (adenosine(37)-N6)-threonylcarbamoyltransferase complex dimerization subunit type 1 TsaB [Bacteroidales bacterium]|jgi:tRNA threonylcarbamoyladenosine biosynthesis protein TsaB|nr:tRNA (adenosine(37)-N6)-threonylcarbamoyltransferase complex dimerization subunit type 1 TsaB [Bacteroidales bacterium]
MALILNIETATTLCSVGLARDSKTISRRETTEEKSHAGKLTVFIEEILNEQGISVSDLNAIAVGKGPGSYTGLRIGISVAKGLCYGSGIPLIAVSTLRILIASALSENAEINADTLFCPMIDARRMEVFCSLSDIKGNEIEPVSARIIDITSFRDYLTKYKIAFFGSGMEKCRNVLRHPNAVFIQGIEPHASSLAVLSELNFQQKLFEDVAYFEPFYLKDFVATLPKKSIRF